MFIPPEYAHYWEAAVQFARAHLSADRFAADDTALFPREIWQACGAFGLPGLPVAPEYGGRGYDVIATAVTMEAIGYSCRDNGLLAAINAHAWSCVLPLWKVGSPEQKARWLPRLCAGDLIGAHAATEANAGSDIFAMQTSAWGDDQKYVLHGQKTYVLNAPVADLFFVFARLTEGKEAGKITGFLVERETPGLTLARRIPKAGLPTAQMGEITLNDCEIPRSNRLGAEGAGMFLFQLSMLWERTLILAPHVGTMRRVLEQCIAYAKQRSQYGQTIGKFQSVSNRIADMKMRVEIAHLLLHHAAEALQRGTRSMLEASLAKLFISEAAIATYMDAIRIHGAAGYTQELEFAQDLQDGIGTVIFSGTSDIQRQIIARYLGL